MKLLSDWEFIKSELKGLNDFIRWTELLYFILLMTAGWLLGKWWGIIIALFIDYMMHTSGGANIGTFPTQEIKGIEKTFYCKMCKKEHTIYLEDKGRNIIKVNK